MGWYVNEKMPLYGKAATLVAEFNAEVIDVSQGLEEVKAGRGVVVVMENPHFDAAGFAFSENEYKAFTNPMDTRPKTILKVDREWLEKTTGYAEVYHEDVDAG